MRERRYAPLGATKALDARVAALEGGSALQNIVEDLTPQLGGPLDMNSQYVSTTLEVRNTAPKFSWYETDGAADGKLWDAVAEAGILRFRSRTDADGNGTDWLQVTRSGNTVTNVEFGGNATMGLNVNTYVDLDDTSNTVGIRLRTAGTQRGYLYADANGIGILNDGGGWSIRHNHSSDDVTVVGQIYPNNQSTGHIQAVSGNYGSVECSGADGSSATWAGWSVDGRAVFMWHPTEQRGGIYDDVDNQWALQWNPNNLTVYEELALYTGAGVVAAYTQDPVQAGVSSGMRLRHPNAVYYDAGFQEMPRTITNASATLSNEDAGGCFYSNNATAYTITLNNQTDFPVEACFFILNYGSGNITISQGTGSLLWPNAGTANSGNRTVGPYSVATIFHYSAGTWFIWGDNIS